MMAVTSLEIKTRGDVNGNVEESINDTIAVSPWMTQDSLKCTERRNNQNISNNQLLDKEEPKTDKIEHQTSVLDLISTTTVNGGRPKVSTLKNNKTSKRERMKRISILLVSSWEKRRILRAFK